MDPSQGNDTGQRINVLSDHEAVKELLSLMKGNGRRLQAAELSYMISAIDKIDKAYSGLYDTVMDQKIELEKLAEECIAVGADPTDIDLSEYQAVQQETEQFLATMDTVKETIIDWAKSSASLFKLVGVSALDTAMSTSNIHNTLNTLRKLACASVFSVLATSVIANIERDSGKFQTVFLTPLQTIKKMLSRANKAAYATIGVVEHLKQTAKVVREARAEKSAVNKLSIRQDLVEKKTQVATPPTPGKAAKGRLDRPGLFGRD